jgi:sporulation protein YlmC with PRC-barrel domain
VKEVEQLEIPVALREHVLVDDVDLADRLALRRRIDVHARERPIASSTDSCSRRPSRRGLSPTVSAAGGRTPQRRATAISAQRKKRVPCERASRGASEYSRYGRAAPFARVRVSLSLSGRVEVREGLMHVRLDELRGRKVFDANGREIGRVKAALVDMETWLVDTLRIGVARHAAAELEMPWRSCRSCGGRRGRRDRPDQRRG